MEGGGCMSSLAVHVGDIWVRRGGQPVLEGATFDVAHGEVVAVMGASGSGKTTLLRTIAGLDRFDRGQLIIDQVTLEPGRAPREVLRALRRTVGMVFQFHGLFEHLRAVENVALAVVHVHGVPAGEAERRARSLLQRLGVEHRAGALPRELSGGEAQRVAIARSLAVDPQVLLMDEPTASLDPVRRMELAELVRGLADQRRAVLVATHDEDFAQRGATRVLRLVDRKVSGDI
jgi:ABC-type polar amino acid transport system ATPase subunit